MNPTISINSLKVLNPDRAYEVILLQANFTIFTIEDLYLRVKNVIPQARLALAMNESEPRTTRVIGNDDRIMDLAAETMKMIGASHAAAFYLSGAYPIQVLNVIKEHPCVCRIYAASSNELEVIVAETPLGRAILGVVDGYSVNHVEDDEERKARQQLVRKLGYFKV